MDTRRRTYFQEVVISVLRNAKECVQGKRVKFAPEILRLRLLIKIHSKKCQLEWYVNIFLLLRECLRLRLRLSGSLWRARIGCRLSILTCWQHFNEGWFKSFIKLPDFFNIDSNPIQSTFEFVRLWDVISDIFSTTILMKKV